MSQIYQSYSKNMKARAITTETRSLMTAIVKNLRNELPPVFARKEAGKLLGGIISPKTLANIEYLGKGPVQVRTVQRSVFYERDSFCTWLEEYLCGRGDRS